MFETILGAIFILGLFLFTAYGLPKMGYRIRGKRLIKNGWNIEERENAKIMTNTSNKTCPCHCHSGHGGCFGMVVDGKEYSHVYCVEKCTHCSQEKNRP